MKDRSDITFYYFPRACSLAVHVALEEAGFDYRRQLIDLRTQAQKKPQYLALNPVGAVPALRIGDQLLTETQAILTYIGDVAPTGPLLPPSGQRDRYRAHQWMNFLSSSVHAYIRCIFRPSAYAPIEDATAQAAVRRQGHANLAAAVATVEAWLTGSPFALGEDFSVVDGYLFLMYLWSCDDRIETVPDRPKWAALAERVWRRPAVKAVVAVEQQDRDFTIPI
ncbi:MAG: glutathione S-transferase N-terminal domain-containing protein [Rhodospirillales bacterium]|nr:glutathione S-transferase N-terminal domain-containing protein [Rhodospirillales bacterium]